MSETEHRTPGATTMATTPQPFTFDWQARHEADGYTGHDFLVWLVPELLADAAVNDRELVDQLAAATENFTAVTLTMQLNGHEIDARRFLDRMDAVTTQAAREEARRLVDASPRLDAIREAITDAEDAMRTELRRVMAAHGIELPEDD